MKPAWSSYRLDSDHCVRQSIHIPEEIDLPAVRRKSFTKVESVMKDMVGTGDRVLVLSYRIPVDDEGHAIIVEHISTRVEYKSIHGGWCRFSVVYMEGELSPYTYDIDPIHAEGFADPLIDLDNMPSLIDPSQEKSVG